MSTTARKAEDYGFRRENDMERENWLATTDDAVLACRGERHNFPKLRNLVGRKRARGLRAQPAPDGAWRLTFTCPDCGTERTMTTLPKGHLSPGASYGYKHPEGYKAPKGVKITPRDCLGETIRRVVEDSQAWS